MFRKIICIVLTILSVVFVFSGCSSLTFNSPENLVRPPKLSGADGELQKAFESAVSEKGEYILKYPSAGNYKSAFVRADCDNDGDSEAFVFYSLKTEEMAVYMYMLDYKNGEWNPVGEVPGEGNDIYSIEFCDLNADGISELLVGWSSIDSKANKKLGIYHSDNNGGMMNYKVIGIEPYTAMYTVDIDADGHQEILTTLINSTSDTYTTEAKLLKMAKAQVNAWQINPIGQANLYSGITAVNNIASCFSGDIRYIYIDEAAGDSYLTEMLYWDAEQKTLVSALKIDPVSIAMCPTSRSLPLVCQDIDGDGELEIPVTKMMQDSNVVFTADETDSEVTLQPAVSTNVYVTSWKKFDEGRFTTVDSYIENSYDNFRLDYDEETMSNWSVRFFADKGLSEFFMIEKTDDPDSPVNSVLLFSISKATISNEVVDSVIALTDVSRYTCQITEAGVEAGFDVDSISKMVTVAEE